MMILKPKNWDKFQHYKDRCPPWIKLHRDLLNDRSYMSLPLASKAIAPLLWLLASESKDGSFDAASEELAFRLRIASKDIDSGLKPLIDNGFFVDASTMLAPCLQLATLETETETERETKTKKKFKKFVVEIPKPDDVSDDVWSDWLKHRESKDASVTGTVIKKIRNESAKISMTLESAMEMMCLRNWQGFQADWVKPKETQQTDWWMNDRRIK